MRTRNRTLAATVALALALAGLVVAAAPGTALASTCSESHLPLPDPYCTPGSYNPNVTQSNIHSTICVSGWTDTVPPTSYTNPLKAQGIIDYGYSDSNMSDYEEDHLVRWNSAAHPATRATRGPSRITAPRPRTRRTASRRSSRTLSAAAASPCRPRATRSVPTGPPLSR